MVFFFHPTFIQRSRECAVWKWFFYFDNFKIITSRLDRSAALLSSISWGNDSGLSRNRFWVLTSQASICENKPIGNHLKFTMYLFCTKKNIVFLLSNFWFIYDFSRVHAEKIQANHDPRAVGSSNTKWDVLKKSTSLYFDSKWRIFHFLLIKNKEKPYLYMHAPLCVISTRDVFDSRKLEIGFPCMLFRS